MTNLDTIAAGLGRVLVKIGRLSRDLPCEPRLQAERARRLAALHTRRARWWTALQRATDYRSGVHSIYRDAAVAAQFHAESQARTWTELAEHWSGQEMAA